jgi:hypothetical protein
MLRVIQTPAHSAKVMQGFESNAIQVDIDHTVYAAESG